MEGGPSFATRKPGIDHKPTQGAECGRGGTRRINNSSSARLALSVWNISPRRAPRGRAMARRTPAVKAQIGLALPKGVRLRRGQSGTETQTRVARTPRCLANLLRNFLQKTLTRRLTPRSW